MALFTQHLVTGSLWSQLLTCAPPWSSSKHQLTLNKKYHASRDPGEHLLRLSFPGVPCATETQFAPGGKHCRKSILGEGDLLKNTETAEWLKATCYKGNKTRIWYSYQWQKARCHTTELHSKWIELLKGRAGKRADENFSGGKENS